MITSRRSSTTRVGVRGAHADILADGEIDVPPASVHQRCKLDENVHTTRLIAAMRKPSLDRMMRRDPTRST